jgi:hypothetical protein
VLSFLDAAHGCPVYRRHIPLSDVLCRFKKFFKFRKQDLVVKRAEKHAGVALVAAVFIYIRAALAIRVFHLYASVLAGHHAGAAAVAVFYPFGQLHDLSPLFEFCHLF